MVIRTLDICSVDRGLAANLAPGRVIAAHRRAVTLETERGALITLADPALGNGPNTILTAHPLEAWSVGDRFWPDGATGIAFAAGPAIDWRSRPLWSAAESAPTGPPRFNHAAILADALRSRGIVAGLLPVLLGAPASDRAQRALRDQAAALLAALPAHAAARGLIGLGPGLTPAGDDLVAGLLLALHYAWHPAAEPLRAVAAQADTTRLGRAMLAWAARGLAGEHALDLLRGLFEQPADRALDALPAALDHGATSGADLAAGILIGLRHIGQAPPDGSD